MVGCRQKGDILGGAVRVIKLDHLGMSIKRLRIVSFIVRSDELSVFEGWHFQKLKIRNHYQIRGYIDIKLINAIPERSHFII